MAYWSKSRGKVYDKLLRTLEAGQKNKSVYANTYENPSTIGTVGSVHPGRRIAKVLPRPRNG